MPGLEARTQGPHCAPRNADPTTTTTPYTRKSQYLLSTQFPGPSVNVIRLRLSGFGKDPTEEMLCPSHFIIMGACFITADVDLDHMVTRGSRTVPVL